VSVPLHHTQSKARPTFPPSKIPVQIISTHRNTSLSATSALLANTKPASRGSISLDSLRTLPSRAPSTIKLTSLAKPTNTRVDKPAPSQHNHRPKASRTSTSSKPKPSRLPSRATAKLTAGQQWTKLSAPSAKEKVGVFCDVSICISAIPIGTHRVRIITAETTNGSRESSQGWYTTISSL